MLLFLFSLKKKEEKEREEENEENKVMCRTPMAKNILRWEIPQTRLKFGLKSINIFTI